MGSHYCLKFLYPLKYSKQRDSSHHTREEVEQLDAVCVTPIPTLPKKPHAQLTEFFLPNVYHKSF